VRDTFGLVEGPVDAEINPALTILLLGLGERREAAREARAHASLVVPRHPVKLIRHEAEGDAVGAVEAAQDLEDRASERGVPGGVGRERRREVHAAAIAGLRAERRPARITRRPDGGDRAPEREEVLEVPARDARVGHGRVDEGQEAGELDSIRAHLVGDVHHDLVEKARRRAQARRAVVAPVDADLGLLGVALGRRRAAGGATRRVAPTTAQALHLVEGGRVRPAVQGRRRWRRELAGGLQDERLDLAPEGAQRDRLLGDRVLAPLAQTRHRCVFAAVELLGNLRAVVGPQSEDGGGRSAPDGTPTPLGLSVPNLIEVFRE